MKNIVTIANITMDGIEHQLFNDGFEEDDIIKQVKPIKTCIELTKLLKNCDWKINKDGVIIIASLEHLDEEEMKRLKKIKGEL